MKRREQVLKQLILIIGFPVLIFFAESTGAQQAEQDLKSIKLRIEFGHTLNQRITQNVKFTGASPGLLIDIPIGDKLENGDIASPESHLNCGADDVDALVVGVKWPKPIAELRKVGASNTKMWKYLLENGSAGQIERLSEDPWKQPDAPILTVQLNKEGTKGFSIGLEQLLNHQAMWLPEQDVFITLANHPLTFEQHIALLNGERTLERIKNEPDASLVQFSNSWTDFGNPLVSDPSWQNWQTKWMGTTGHLIVTAAAHGSIYKFAIDRWGNVRPDFASPYKFRLDLIWNDSKWKMQQITNGLPVVVTTLENKGQVCEIEQFASPLGEIDAAIRGYIPSVMFSRIRISRENGPVNFGIQFNNEEKNRQIELKKSGNNNWIVADKRSGNILLMLETRNELNVEIDKARSNQNGQKLFLTVSGELKKEETREFVIKLPSPAVNNSQLIKLNDLEFSSAKNNVIKYWEKWLEKGARFHVPEEAVNQLFRANLWHALVLPRHTIKNSENHMDIPYSNIAYGQQNADWPINQTVYVDYMIYGLRGYNQVAENELAAMFKSQQLPDGQIGGFANWGVYSPGFLYAVAQNYLLNHNRQQFERLLPNSLKTLDWCLLQIAKANIGMDKTGLILAPLNDLSHSEQEWAFTQAYFAGGLEVFGRALSLYGHPRADEVNKIASKMKKEVIRAFARASVKSPIVQLADGTWSNYVPTDALTPRRLLDQWYPSDVDTGPLHLSRLGVINASSWLTTAMLNDHEDNLFLNNLGAADEPVYVPQATVYLLRDEPKAVIRSFYSMMSCAFSHQQLTSLEHRWAHPIYYSPPSTDGAWFEVYRKMLLNEFGTDTLFIGQAIPRDWLQKGKKVEVKDAPTYFGPVSFTIEGVNSNDEITAGLEISNRNLPKELLVRFRHPESAKIRSVIINDKPWKNYDAEKEYIRIPEPTGGKYVITAKY
ncbi:MAG TPA: hypothetical protein VKA38_03015 [Draconibacterium sp.]|nr:hypothetical protein [Draconibacterium sp.]